MKTNKYCRYTRLLLLCLFLGTGTSLFGQDYPIKLRVENVTAQEKDTFTVALVADSTFTGRNVMSFRLQLSYTASYLEFIDISSTGAVMSGWNNLTTNSSSAGNLVFAAAGATPLSGTGAVVYLRFRAIQAGGSYISFNTGQSYLNEGSPTCTFTSSYISISARPKPDITPDASQIYVGEEVTLSTYNGVAPFTYNVENTSVATIVNGNKLRGVGPGTTRAYVTDKNGEVNYSTGVFDVRAVKLRFTTSAIWPNQNFNLPVLIEIAPGTTLFSGSFDLVLPSGLLPLEEASPAGDFSLTIEKRNISGRVRVAFATAQGISGNGILTYIPVKAETSGSKYIYFENVLFNESLLSFVTNAYLNVNQLPSLSITPNTGTLMWGDSLQLNATNGTAPYSYSISNTDIASIDETGKLRALKGGTVKVTASDTNGASITSNTFYLKDCKVTINSTDGILDGNTRVTISTSALPASRKIFGFEGDISFQSNYLEFVNIEPFDPSMIVTSVLNGSTIKLGGATSSGISSGTIFYLNFKIKNTLALYNSTSIGWNSLTLNEGALSQTLANGTITRAEQTSYRPVAKAGNNISAPENTLVQLNGSGSFDDDGDDITYSWTAPSGIILNNTKVVNPTFTAPEVPTNTNYVFSLVVNDGTSNSDPSTVTVTVQQVNKAPLAKAGPDASVNEGANVTLDGSASSDPDPQTLIFNWLSLDGIVLFNANQAKPTFIAPQVSANTNYRFALLVSDGTITSPADTVTVQVKQVNKAPIAFAGNDQTVNEGDQVQLDASLSNDPDNDAISYSWGTSTAYTLSTYTDPKPTFTAPVVHLDSTITIPLTVSDGFLSTTDNVTITIKNLDELSTNAKIDSVMLTGLLSFNIDTIESVITLYLPYGHDISKLAPQFKLPEWATISPAGGTVRNFAAPLTYTVTAEDVTVKRQWTVQVFVPEPTVTRTLQSGWNWLSLPVDPTDNTLDGILGDLTLENLDYIKSPVTSAVWYNGLGWFGDLKEFPQALTLKLKKATSETLSVTGKEINPTTNPVTVTPGWNSLPYLLKTNTDINNAFIESTIPNGSVLVKGESGSAVYYAASGWTGDLTTLIALSGYKIKVAAAGQIKYNAAAPVKPAPALPTLKSAPAFAVETGQFEHSANMIAEFVDGNGNPATQANDKLLAYAEKQLRGAAQAVFVPDLGRYIFILTYYSGTTDEPIRLKAVRDNQETALNEALLFKPDEITGEAYNPAPLNWAVTSGLTSPNDRLMVQILPNPAQSFMRVIANEPIECINLINTSGQTVKSFPHPQLSEKINISGIPAGIYLVEARTSNGVHSQKLIKAGE